jgi:hypothetical protein
MGYQKLEVISIKALGFSVSRVTNESPFIFLGNMNELILLYLPSLYVENVIIRP